MIWTKRLEKANGLQFSCYLQGPPTSPRLRPTAFSRGTGTLAQRASVVNCYPATRFCTASKIAFPAFPSP